MIADNEKGNMLETLMVEGLLRCGWYKPALCWINPC